MCLHKGCNLKLVARGYCEKHYRQFKKYGKTFKSTTKDFNEIIDKGRHYELILINIKMEEVARCKIDKEDLSKVKAIGRWSLNLSDGYVYNTYTNKAIHRIITDAKEGECVDHRKPNSKLDNRKKNLRVCTYSNNSQNRGKPSNNTSGYKGVAWSKKNKKWKAEITVKNKYIYLGLFNTPEEAYEAYCEAGKKLHGKFFNKG